MKGLPGLSRIRFDVMDHPRVFRAIINSWPPFLGAAIKVAEIADDWRTIRVEMRLRWYNRNYVKSHFGGSLFAMTDPFYMLLLLRNLGRDFVVWDLEAQIHYLRPGRGRVSALFGIDEQRLAEIRGKAASGEKVTEIFYAEVIDEEGERVASVKKTLYIRKKRSDGVHDRVASTKPLQAAPLVTDFSWGRIVVEGLGAGRDWQLWPRGGCPWDWRVHETGHWRGVAREDIEELVERGATTVIIGNGRFRRLRVSPVLIDEFAGRGIAVIVASTATAIARYNELAGNGVSVGGLFHSTC